MHADFLRFYGGTPRGLHERGVSLLDVASCAAHLPPDSAVEREAAGDSAWVTPEIEFLREIEFSLRALVWMKTKDAERGRNRPAPHPLPGESPPVDVETVGAGEGFASLAEADAWRVEYFERKRREKESVS